jgi:nitrogen regulatory protein PII-like uncharacterized protein
MTSRTLIFTFALWVTLCIGATGFFASAAQSPGPDKAQQLKQKIEDIKLLKQQLQDRSQKADSVLNELLALRNEIVSEVRILVKSLNIKNLEQARKHHRMHYNIELLRFIVAYIDEFDSKVRLYRTGIDKLTYLHQLAADDIRMVSTLSDFRIDALTTQISLVINRYMPEAHTIRIDPRHVLNASDQSVWDAISKGTY